MSNEETSAYLLMAAGAFWILVGIVGLMQRPREELLDHEQNQHEN
jgi:hypothetical protein